MSFSSGFHKTAGIISGIGALAGKAFLGTGKAVGKSLLKDPLGAANKAMATADVLSQGKGNFDKLQEASART